MRGQELNLLFLFAIVFFGFIIADKVPAETLKKKIGERKPSPIVIDSKTLEVNNELKTVTFLGDVVAKQDDMVITCEKVVVYYGNSSSKKESEKVETKIDKIVATGDVKIDRAQGGTATAREAVYDLKDEKIVLTGKSVVRQGNDFVEGDRITIFLKENRSVVESSKEKKVRAIIFPSRVKR